MAYEQKDMSGSLFKNDRKSTESQPNAKGSATIAGVEYWVSSWTKTDKNGNPWMSLAFTAKEPKPEEQKPAEPAQASKGHPAFADMDSDIPF